MGANHVLLFVTFSPYNKPLNHHLLGGISFKYYGWVEHLCAVLQRHLEIPPHMKRHLPPRASPLTSQQPSHHQFQSREVLHRYSTDSLKVFLQTIRHPSRLLSRVQLSEESNSGLCLGKRIASNKQDLFR